MRGVLKRVVSRKRDRDGKRSECMLECGHVISRSISSRSENCYCTTCPPAAEETKTERQNRLARERRERRKKLLTLHARRS